MKKFIIFCLIATVFLACKEKQQSSHEVQWSGNAKDSVVYVNHQNQDGSFSNFYMNYLLYSTLFRQGGYSGVNSYYNSHRSEFSNQSRYHNYTNYKKNNINSNSVNSTPSRILNNSNITPTKCTPSKSYSTPSRSSSPSRSYSSPSRSYSSPSRSYSSPSRSGRR